MLYLTKLIKFARIIFNAVLSSVIHISNIERKMGTHWHNMALLLPTLLCMEKFSFI